MTIHKAIRKLAIWSKNVSSQHTSSCCRDHRRIIRIEDGWASIPTRERRYSCWGLYVTGLEKRFVYDSRKMFYFLKVKKLPWKNSRNGYLYLLIGAKTCKLRSQYKNVPLLMSLLESLAEEMQNCSCRPDCLGG